MTESAAALQEHAKPAKPVRQVFRYQVPDSLKSIGVLELGMVQLTSNEELQATKRSRNDSHRLGYELAKQSLVEIDGHALKVADGSADTAWDQLHPKIRMLVISAYSNLHAPEEEDVNDFLKSQRVEVG